MTKKQSLEEAGGADELKEVKADPCHEITGHLLLLLPPLFLVATLEFSQTPKIANKLNVFII